MSKTLTLKEAAKLLKCSQEALRLKAKAGQIPGAKPTKAWVFIEEDLIAFIRSQYTAPAEQVVQVAGKEVIPCHLPAKARKAFGTSASRIQMESEYNAALGLPTED